jgi:prepilin-type N-terminal cleavage/methylation domain-containing protein
MSRSHHLNSQRRGLSLLEVLLALAVLGMSLAVIAEIARIGGRSAEQARDLSTAQIHCESLMAQVVTGLIAPTPVADIPIDDPNAAGEWVYSLEVQPVDQQGLLAVKVTVTQDPDVFPRPVAFALGRWMIDPDTMTSATTTGQSTGSSTGSASGSSTAASSGSG